MTTTPTVWRAAFQVNTQDVGPTNNDQNFSTVVQLAGGDYIVFWTDLSDASPGQATGDDIVAQRFNALGNRVGAEFRANNGFFAENERLADVAALADGGYVIAYERREVISGDSHIRANRYDAAGANLFSFIITDDPGAADQIGHPAVATNADGSFFVFWQQTGAAGAPVRGALVSAANAVGAPANYIIGSSSVGDFGQQVETDTLANGTQVIASRSNNADPYISIRGVNATGGNVFNAAIVANTQVNGDTDVSPDIAALTGGGFVVVWQNTDANDTDLMFQRYNNAGVAQGGVVSVADDSAADVDNQASVVGLDDGGFFIVWRDGQTPSIRGQRYDASGVQVGGRVTLATDVADHNLREPALEKLQDGRILASWTDRTVSAGNDDIVSVIYDPRENNLTYGSASQVLTTRLESTTLSAGGGGDTVFGQGGDDTINGEGGDDVLNGGAGLDTMNGGSGLDTLNGDAGNDTLNGGSEADTLNGGADSDILNGDAGDDTLNGGAAGDTLNGGTGADTLNGGAGDDVLAGGFGTDTVNGNEGNDTIVILDAEFIDNVAGGADIDTLNLSTFTAHRATINLDAGTWDVSPAFGGPCTIAGIEILYATQLDDSIVGSAAAETIYGNAGDDTINGGDGADILFGGAGLDTVFGGDGDDYIQGDAGASSVLSGDAGADSIYGGDGNDYMIGGAGADVMVGFGGQDSLYGGAGDDYLVAGDGPGAVVDGGAGANTLWGAGGADYIVGGEGADLAVGGAGSDYLFGNAGDDTLYGGQGTDFLFSNAGNDFIWTDDVGFPQAQDFIYVGGGTGVDTVADFTITGAAHDVVVISPASGIGNFTQLQAAMTQVGVYTVITMSGGDQLFLYNVQPFQLTADNFLFI